MPNFGTWGCLFSEPGVPNFGTWDPVDPADPVDPVIIDPVERKGVRSSSFFLLLSGLWRAVGRAGGGRRFRRPPPPPPQKQREKVREIHVCVCVNKEFLGQSRDEGRKGTVS